MKASKIYPFTTNQVLDKQLKVTLGELQKMKTKKFL